MTLTPVVRTLAAVVAGLLPVTLLVAQPAPVAVAASGAARAAATSIDDRALIRSGKGWVKVSSRSAFKKTLLKGTRAGATARTKGAATVGGKVTFQAGPGRGQATIKVGGKKRKTVSTAKKRLSPLTVSFSGPGRWSSP